MSFARKLLAKSVILLVARIGGAAVMFLVQAAIARHFGTAMLGRYLVAIAPANLIAVALPLGFPAVANFFGAEYSARGQGQLLSQFFTQSLVQTAIMTVVMAAAGPYLVHGVIAEEWQPISLTAVAVAILMLTAGLLISLKRPLLGLMGDAVLRPLFVVAGFLVAVSQPSPDPVNIILLVAGGLSAVLALGYALLCARIIRQLPPGTNPRGEQNRWWFYALPWAAMALATDFFFDLDMLLLQGLLPLQELALFGIAAKLFGLASFAVGSVYAIALPDAFEAEASGSRPAFLSRMLQVNAVATALAAVLPPAALFIAPMVLGFVGPGFEGAAAPLAMLCLSLVMRSAFGPGATILSIAKRPYLPLGAVGLALLALVTGNLMLVPRYGLMGACASATIAISLWSLSLWLIALLSTGIDASLFPALARFRTRLAK